MTQIPFKGWWEANRAPHRLGFPAVQEALLRVNRPLSIVVSQGQIGVGLGGITHLGTPLPSEDAGYPLLAYTPSLHPKELGDSSFKNAHGLTYAYVVGAMANGITSVKMVQEAGRSGFIGFFGAAGLTLDQIESAIDQLQKNPESVPYGFNLIHTPTDPQNESAVVDLYLRRGVKRVSASAYLDLTLPLVRYRVTGVHRDFSGTIVCPNKIFAKVSRIEVAKKFFSPPPNKLLTELVNRGWITSDESIIARQVPMAEDLTAEADSGGHTDNRPAISLLPTMLSLRDEISRAYGKIQPTRVGLAGGIATPVSVAAAFAMGAAYVLTGSINQSCVESGTSDAVREMLAETTQADVAMAPAADMFELGVKVQVLKRGTLFPFRAAKLHELYSVYDNYDQIPDKQKAVLERDFFRCSFETEWEATKAFFAERDPNRIERGEKEPKHKMALVFRSYLGKSSLWANTGDPNRKIDYQIWCGPAMGAFNQWAKGSFMERPENRHVVAVAVNLLYGAAVLTRLNWIRYQGVELPPGFGAHAPLPLAHIEKLLADDRFDTQAN